MSDSNPQNNSPHDRHWIDDVLEHPLLWGVLTLIAFAIGFTPKGSTLGSVICLILAWALLTRMIYTFPRMRAKSRRQRKKVTGIVSLIALVIIAGFGWWLVLPSTATSEVVAQQPTPIVTPTPSPSSLPSPLPSPTLTPTPTDEEHIFIDKPDDVLRRLSKCSRAAQAQICTQPYIGKWVEISGRVHKIAELTLNQPPYKTPIMSISAKRKYPQKYIGAYCERFAEEWKAHAMLSDVGEAVTLSGRITKISGRRFWLEDCEFVE
jgi:heme/copper-type cytochrome/quinol oxidase subunit 4